MMVRFIPFGIGDPLSYFSLDTPVYGLYKSFGAQEPPFIEVDNSQMVKGRSSAPCNCSGSPPLRGNSHEITRGVRA